MARVLVTGGNGFIGGHLCRALERAGHHVRIFDLPGARRDGVADLAAEQVTGDICNHEDVIRAMRGIDVVYHLAAKVADWGRWRDFERITVGGTRNVLVAAKLAGVKQVVLMSSLAVHGWSSHINADEATPRDVDASYPYGVAKRLCEDMALEAHAHGHVAATIIRPGFFPFGPWDNTSFAQLADNMAKGRLALLNGGRARTCVVYVENLAAGMALARLNERAYGETFVLADDGQYTWRQLFDAIAEALGVPPVTRSLPGSVAYGAAWLMDRLWLAAGAKKAPLLTRYRINVARSDTHYLSTKARDVLGYAPAIPFAEGLRRTVEWYKNLSTK